MVQDLFLIGSIALERSGNKLSMHQRNRLRAAARYGATFMRPDNKCPLIGDSDDAVVFDFDNYPTRDHRSGMGVAAIAFKDAELKAAAGRIPVAGLWFFGKKAVTDWQKIPEISRPFQGQHYFDKGGMVISKSARHYLIVDVGK